MSLQGNSPFYPLVLMITERKRERESARESEREGCACVCLCLSMWQTEAETLRAPDKKTHQVSVSWTARTLQHHQDNRGPHLGDLSQKAAARDLYDQTALTSPCRDRAVQARRFPLILWLALHSPGRATCSTRATRCLCRTDRLWFHKPCLIRHYRRASLPWHRWHRSRGAWPTLFARGWGRGCPPCWRSPPPCPVSRTLQIVSIPRRRCRDPG